MAGGGERYPKEVRGERSADGTADRSEKLAAKRENNLVDSKKNLLFIIISTLLVTCILLLLCSLIVWKLRRKNVSNRGKQETRLNGANSAKEENGVKENETAALPLESIIDLCGRTEDNRVAQEESLIVAESNVKEEKHNMDDESVALCRAHNKELLEETAGANKINYREIFAMIEASIEEGKSFDEGRISSVLVLAYDGEISEETEV
ncbi:uncharacterized protein LOC134602333 [Pelobates fuscus]|uniref:uncharacterized protein LOC134602333 n=1 Tax=Pelobates fuscus TaxID=191477 RepID=UPI002FE4E27D